MQRQFWLFGRLVVVLIVVVLAQADYIMDDSNSTIQYSGYWTRADILSVNSSKVYNGTVYVVGELFIASLLILHAV